jgi:hypothetical protein
MLDTKNQEEYISFLADKPPAETKASALLWIGAAVTFFVHFGISLTVASARGKEGASLIGTLIGACFWPVVITAISSRWNNTQRGRVKVFFITCLALVLLSITTFLAVRGYTNFTNR